MPAQDRVREALDIAVDKVDGLIPIWMVTLLIFLLLRMSGNPIEILVPRTRCSKSVSACKVFYGLDKPVWQQ
jgi:ABC-type dipeptide/oligopeptide/nickel transport system permease component